MQSKKENIKTQLQVVAFLFAIGNIFFIASKVGYQGLSFLFLAAVICGFVSIILNGNLAGAIGKVVKSRYVKGQIKNATIFKRNIIVFHSAISFLISLILYLYAELICNKMEMPYSIILFKILIPVIFIRSSTSVFGGFLNGEGAEIIGNIVNIVRQILVFILCIIFSKLFTPYGEKVSSILRNENYEAVYTSIGIAIAVLIAEVFICILMFLAYRLYKSTNDKKRNNLNNRKAKESFWESIRIVFQIRIGNAGVLFLYFLPFFMLLFFAGVKSNENFEAFGVYLVIYFGIIGILALFVMANMTPNSVKMLDILKKEEPRYARLIFRCGMHIGLVHAIYLCAFIIAMSKYLSVLFTGINEEYVKTILAMGAPIIVTAPLTYYMIRIMTYIGKNLMIMISLFLSNMIFIVANIIGVKMFSNHIYSILVSLLMNNLIIVFILGLVLYKHFKVRANLIHIFVLPLFGAVFSCASVYFLSGILMPHLGVVFTIMLSMIISSILYWVILLLTHDFKEQELEEIAGGKIIEAIGQIMKVY